MKINYNTDAWRLKIETAIDNEKSMAAAARTVGMNYKTLRKYAQLYGKHKPNQAGIGVKKTRKKIPLCDILKGLHPQYQTNKLRKRLIEEKIFEHKCSNCFLERWLDVEIPLELHHVNGVSTDHVINNLRLLCPNCHALTNNYRGKNKKSLNNK